MNHGAKGRPKMTDSERIELTVDKIDTLLKAIKEESDSYTCLTGVRKLLTRKPLPMKQGEQT